MNNRWLMAFDTETGSIRPEAGDLLTFYGAILDEDLKIVDELDLKLKPDGGRLPIAEAQALKVNGIDIKAHLENPATITYSEARTQLVTMLKRYLKKTGRFSNIRAFGYNVPFDVKWTQHHILSAEEWESILHYKHIDVMQNVDFLKECGWFPQDLGSLGTVVDYLGIPKLSAHNAKEDTLMTIDVYRRLLDIMKDKREGSQPQDLISLLEAE